MRLRLRPLLLTTALTAPHAYNALADTQFSAGASLGYEADSNVSVDEVDRASGQGDTATTASVDLSVDQTLGESIKGSMSYSYARTDYNAFTNLSRETHIGGIDLNLDMGEVTGGINYFYIRALLDGSDFLTFQRVSPSLSGFISKRWFLRTAFVHSEKTISNRPGRDASSDGAELDAYFFWQGLRRYINAGYIYKTENSDADRFDFDSHTAKLRFLQRFDFYDELASFEIAARYEYRDYLSITPTIGTERYDRRLRIKAELELPLSKSVFWQFYSVYGDYDSNLSFANYQQTVIGTQLEVDF